MTIHTIISTSNKQQHTMIIIIKNIYLFIYLFILLASFLFFTILFLSGNTGVFS